jgi:hypothetical protein
LAAAGAAGCQREASAMDKVDQDIRNIITIGELERAAGITDREAFWHQYGHLKGERQMDAGVADLRRMAADRRRGAAA